jgi:hypothetical protein
MLWLLLTLVLTAHAAKVSFQGRKVFVDGKQFFMKGINYNPIPAGYGRWDIDPFLSKDLVDRDIANLVKLKVNTVRIIHIYSSNPESKLYLLDRLYENGIYAVLGFFPQAKEWTNPAFRQDCKDQTKKIVQAYKDHPATLMWLFANELNLPSKGNTTASFSLVKEVRNMIHEIEGPDNWHPLVTTLADYKLVEHLQQFSDSVDAWGIQSYRGFSFGSLFTQVSGATSLPVVMMEYGIDSYDTTKNKEDQDVQAKAARMLYKEVVDNKNVFSGAFIFQYADAWWKAGSPSQQDFGGWNAMAFPDQKANEEWWGVYRITPGVKGGIDVLTARKVVDVLAEIHQPDPYGENSPVQPTKSPTTKAPTTKSPTKAPTTKSPTTKAPTTKSPTKSPNSKSPTTKAPTTKSPTKAPTTKAPTTKAPTTKAPTTKAPTTKAPTTKTPTTKAPTKKP